MSESVISASASAGQPLTLGTRVRVRGSLAYLKTADPMPMLRPPDLVEAGEVGEVVGLRALEQLAVRFRRGTFLLEARQLERVEEPAND
jgi:hypothetical protein